MNTYTHSHSDAVLGTHARRTVENSASYLLPYLSAGQKLLDVGAGPGTITAGFARRVDAVTVVEISDEVVEVARQNLADAGCQNVDFVVGDIHCLPFADASFEVVHAHQVLQHVADPVQALRELARVCKPGGYVVVRDADYGAFAWYPESAGMERWRELYTAVARSNGGEPNAGRRLRFWAREAGLDGAQVTTSNWTYASADETAFLGNSWATRCLESSPGPRAVELGLATEAELQEASDAWRTWGADPDAWFIMPNTEVLWQKPRI